MTEGLREGDSMSVAISMNYSAYSYMEMSNTQVKAENKAGIVENPDGSQGFDRVLMGNTPKELPSFIGRVFTEEELYQYVDDKVKSNQANKLSTKELLERTCIEGTRASFRFAGESKVYSFYEYIDELNRRSGNKH